MSALYRTISTVEILWAISDNNHRNIVNSIDEKKRFPLSMLLRGLLYPDFPTYVTATSTINNFSFESALQGGSQENLCPDYRGSLTTRLTSRMKRKKREFFNAILHVMLLEQNATINLLTSCDNFRLRRNSNFARSIFINFNIFGNKSLWNGMWLNNLIDRVNRFLSMMKKRVRRFNWEGEKWKSSKSKMTPQILPFRLIIFVPNCVTDSNLSSLSLWVRVGRMYKDTILYKYMCYVHSTALSRNFIWLSNRE